MSGCLSHHVHAYLRDTAATDLAQTLPRLPALEWLELRNICMDSAGFQAVVRAAEEHGTLWRLSYHKSGLPPGVDTSARCLDLQSTNSPRVPIRVTSPFRTMRMYML
ncbi:uncharacterized protein LOC144905988 [Branchiostoma floridae x Branchiostoma belcheri]